MSFVGVEFSHDHDYPAIELDMANFMNYLSDEYVCGKTEVRNDGVQSNSKIIDCKIEDYAELGEISSTSGVRLEREKKVTKLDIEFVVFYHNGLR